MFRFALVTFALLLPLAANAQTRVDEQRSLRDLSGVRIIVERLHADAEQIELTRADLTRDLVYRLERSKVPILTDEATGDDTRPYLYVNCNVIYVPDIELVSFSIDVELHQRATLDSGEEMAVLTWERSYLGVQHKTRAAAKIRGALGQFIEEFIANYVAANPERDI